MLTTDVTSWTSAQAMPTESGPALLKVKNPDGTTDNLIFDVHSKTTTHLPSIGTRPTS